MKKWPGVVVVGFLCFACSGETGAPVSGESAEQRAAEDLSIREYLARNGEDLRLVVLEEHDVRIDGDMMVPRAAILAAIEAELDGDEPVEKAYWFAGVGRNGLPVAVPNVAHATFRFASNVPTPWRDAVRYAASQWNKTTCIHFTESSSGLTLFNIGDAGNDATGGPAAAHAELPVQDRLGFRHGNRVTISTSNAGSTDTPWMRSLMLHEIGHVFGFKHPWEGVHLAGTATNSRGCCTASYATVMDYTNTEQALTSDDLKAANLVYKKTAGPGRTLVCH